MRQWEYAKEPFDLKLFVYHCAHRLHHVLLGALVGLILIGGGYYLKNVVFADPAPYQVVDKYYVEYGTDPQILVSYSYFAGYTWDDWVKSDEWVGPVLERLDFDMTKEELVPCLKAEIKSDVRIPYLTVTHPDESKALAIAESYRQSMVAFGESQKELVSIRLMDREGPEMVKRDIRVLRACILGVVLGAFFVWFFIGLFFLMDERVYVPEQLTMRYGLPVAGSIDRKGKVSPETESLLPHLAEGISSLGVSSIQGRTDVEAAVRELAFMEQPLKAVACPLETPANWEELRKLDALLVLVDARRDGGKAVAYFLQQCKAQDVAVKAMLLVNADEKLIRFYRFRIWRGKGE